MFWLEERDEEEGKYASSFFRPASVRVLRYRGALKLPPAFHRHKCSNITSSNPPDIQRRVSVLALQPEAWPARWHGRRKEKSVGEVRKYPVDFNFPLL